MKRLILLFLLAFHLNGMAQSPTKFCHYHLSLELNAPIIFMRVETFDITAEDSLFKKAMEYSVNFERKTIGILEYKSDGSNNMVNVLKFSRTTGFKMKETLNNEESYYEWDCKYDKSGNLTDESCTCNFEPYSNKHFSYSKKMLSDIVETKNNKVAERTVFTYGESGKVKSKEVQMPSVSSIYKIIYQYDGDGNVLEITTFGAKNVVKKRQSFVYENGRLKESDTSDEKKFYEYDTAGRLVVEKQCDAVGRVKRTLSYIYLCDKRGNWIMRTEYQNGQPIAFIERKITYAK